MFYSFTHMFIVWSIIYQIYLTFYKKRYNPDLERLTLSIFDLKGLEVCC